MPSVLTTISEVYNNSQYKSQVKDIVGSKVSSSLVYTWATCVQHCIICVSSVSIIYSLYYNVHDLLCAHDRIGCSLQVLLTLIFLLTAIFSLLFSQSDSVCQKMPQECYKHSMFCIFILQLVTEVFLMCMEKYYITCWELSID